MSQGHEFDTLVLSSTNPSDSWLSPEDVQAEPEPEPATEFPGYMDLPVEVRTMIVSEAVKDRMTETLPSIRLLAGQPAEYQHSPQHIPPSEHTVTELGKVSFEFRQHAKRSLFSRNVIIFDLHEDEKYGLMQQGNGEHPWLSNQTPEHLRLVRDVYIRISCGLDDKCEGSVHLLPSNAEEVLQHADLVFAFNYVRMIRDKLSNLERVTIDLEVSWSADAELTDDGAKLLKAAFLDLFRESHLKGFDFNAHGPIAVEEGLESILLGVAEWAA